MMARLTSRRAYSSLIVNLLLLTTIFASNRVDAQNTQPSEDKNDDEFETLVQPFFKTHCLTCHGTKKQKAERRFDGLQFPIPNDDMLIDFQDALDQLNLGEMPPSDRPQPTDQKKAAVIAWLTTAIEQTQANRKTDNGETILRRLNRREYLATISDLFDIDTRGFDPTEGFPADQKVHHLDNQGEALVTSGFLLHQYLLAAEKIIDKAIPSIEKPKVQTWFFDRGFMQQPELDYRRIRMETGAAKRQNKEVKKSELPGTIRIYENPRAQRHMGSYGFIAGLAEGVPEDGFYELTLDLQAMHRRPKYKENHSGTDPDEPIIFAITPGDKSYSELHIQQPLEPELARFELSDKRETIKTKVLLNKGTTPRFIWPNGSGRMRAAHIEVGKILLAKKGQMNPAVESAFVHGLEFGKLPHIRIYSAKVRGPFFDQWPSAIQTELLGGSKFDPSKNKTNLINFLSRAFRRPVQEKDVSRFLDLIERRQQQGVNPLQAYKNALSAVLCSPSFLYLDEPATDDDGTLGQHAIAARLSYFLWSSVPDQRLRQLADEKKLANPAVLKAEVRRMLKDPRSERLITGFLESWLTLDLLGQTPPENSGSFRVYHDQDLERAMEQETILFTRHILDEGLSIDNFLDSDFVIVNAALAKLYGLSNIPKGNKFQKVNIEKQGNRGGLLGQASLLTVTANGVDTSPIVRGVWVLENILGTPPSPPPPDIEPLDPDIRGAKTIRDQLEKHRSNASCAECHRKIDPLGFALENFDPIGRYRSRYNGSKKRKGAKIDASGEVFGKPFEGIVDFKRILLKQKDQFAKALTEKMMAYALGRTVEISDRPQIDSILSELDEHDRSFRFLVESIVCSPNFIRP